MGKGFSRAHPLGSGQYGHAKLCPSYIGILFLGNRLREGQEVEQCLSAGSDKTGGQPS
jgi:hypothetical protein